MKYQFAAFGFGEYLVLIALVVVPIVAIILIHRIVYSAVKRAFREDKEKTL